MVGEGESRLKILECAQRKNRCQDPPGGGPSLCE
jgi:hypothetical protein